METLYNLVMKDRSSEEILQSGAATHGGAVAGESGEYLRIGAQVRAMQELMRSLENASRDSGKLARHIVMLTSALVAVGILQAVATGWPYLAWWWHHML